MTNSLLDERPAAAALKGSQTPRIHCRPDYEVSSGPELIEFCSSVGMNLDEWQQLILTDGLGERPDGKWAAFEAGEVVPRQNGKGDVFMAREVGGLFLFEEELLIHSAHEFKTCGEAFIRICDLIENCDYLRKKCKKPRLTTGQEAIELVHGGRLKFIARSLSSGRGFTADTILLDEAQILSDGPIRAMLPTLSAVPNPQIWYAGTAGADMAIQLGQVRRRAIRGTDKSLAYLEWSVDEDDYDPSDPNEWAKANPALGIRISVDYVSRERGAMSTEGFAAERLGVGDWPSDTVNKVIPADNWEACQDAHTARPEAPVVFAVDTNLERTGAAIAVAGRRPDGVLVVELADKRPDLEWVVERCVELNDQWQPACWVVDAGGPAGTLVAPLERAGLVVVVPTAADAAKASEGFYDDVMAGQLRHTGDRRLDAAVAGVSKRIFVDGAWVWARRTSSTDISPLLAATFARWGYLAEAEGLGQASAYVI